MAMTDQKSVSYTTNPVTNDMMLFGFPGCYVSHYAECDPKTRVSNREPVTV